MLLSFRFHCDPPKEWSWIAELFFFFPFWALAWSLLVCPLKDKLDWPLQAVRGATQVIAQLNGLLFFPSFVSRNILEWNIRPLTFVVGPVCYSSIKPRHMLRAAISLSVPCSFNCEPQDNYTKLSNSQFLTGVTVQPKSHSVKRLALH